MSSSARAWWRLDPGGLIIGVAAIALSMTPSLLPRPAILQGVVSGVSFAIGYAVGVASTIGASVVLVRRAGRSFDAERFVGRAR